TAFANAMLIDPTVRAEDVSTAKQESSAYQDLFRFAGEDNTARRIVVMYGSEYGFSKEVAAGICGSLAEKSIDGATPSLRYVSTADHHLIDWTETHTCLFVCSTAGDGVPPVPAKPFFDFLDEEKPDLSGLRFATLALGDRAYPNFCRAGHTLHGLLTQCGGQSLLPVCEVDNEDSQAIESWRSEIAESLARPALWQDQPQEPSFDALRERAHTHFTSLDDTPRQPNSENPLTAVLKSKRALSTLVEAGDNEVLHVEIDLSGCDGEAPLSWEPGDALGIIPSNCPKEVDACLAGLGATGDEHIQVSKGRNAGTQKSLREALTQDLDIKMLGKSLLNLFVDTQEDRSESIPGSDLASCLDQRELQDLLRNFPKSAEKLVTQDIVDKLRPLQPRLYSIASSMKKDSKRIALCVAVVRYELLGRARTGLATTYIADRVSEGQEISVYLHSNPNFRVPAEDSNQSCVMIGAGTGLAPYRAFLQELSNRSSKRPHLLFLGCRYEERDFLYRDELHAWRDRGVVELVTAFSRDQADKIYVQHRMRQQGPLLFQRMELGDHFYICGDATHMAGDVERALLEIVQENGNKSEVEAKGYLEEMRKDGRLQKDVWAV
ncbi:MAG: flavodoxin domain-containing protein, partial [Deltaproteobacteria bacterium]|nr:flavodoxin domain-containing protein [Deltaproteobacteria bacterium]